MFNDMRYISDSSSLCLSLSNSRWLMSGSMVFRQLETALSTREIKEDFFSMWSTSTVKTFTFTSPLKHSARSK